MRTLAIRHRAAGPATRARILIILGVLVAASIGSSRLAAAQESPWQHGSWTTPTDGSWRQEGTGAGEAPSLSEELFGDPGPGTPNGVLTTVGAGHPSSDTATEYLDGSLAPPSFTVASGETWHHQVMPDGLIYRPYLAGVKESRFAGQWCHDSNLGWMWDITLGGRVGILRYGTASVDHPEGWQLDMEGAGMPRLDLEHEERDLMAADFRFGTPLTFGRDRYQMKLAYYHLSSHLGDEYMVRHNTLIRRNYSRDVVVWGHSYYLHDDLRIYGEAGWAFSYDGGTEPWEFQFGIDYSPARPSGQLGAPFFAANAHLREEFDFGGNFVVQAGWQWRGYSGHLFRVGMHYFQGMSDQWEFFDQYEDKIGFGIWYDY